VKLPSHKATLQRLRNPVAMQGEPVKSDLRPAPVTARCMVLMMSPRIERSRSVPSIPGLKLQHPGLARPTEPPKLRDSPNHQSPKFGVAIARAWSEISHTGSIIRSATEHPVEPGPALSLDFLF